MRLKWGIAAQKKTPGAATGTGGFEFRIVRQAYW
tara:strand:- start:908 stop:1009 length:102 start_codon:yes stop_codon:yes gene_type:complete